MPTKSGRKTMEEMTNFERLINALKRVQDRLEELEDTEVTEETLSTLETLFIDTKYLSKDIIQLKKELDEKYPDSDKAFELTYYPIGPKD